MDWFITHKILVLEMLTRRNAQRLVYELPIVLS
jgi:hypothetical protein